MPKSKKSMNLQELFLLKLKALYYVENKLTKALPKMAKAATDTDLKANFTEHAMETQGHLDRLETIFASLDVKPTKLPVDAIGGLIADAEWCIKNIRGEEALDASLTAAAQYVEHYEMAGYRTLAEWAEMLDLTEAKAILGETLEEEKMADQKLSELARQKLNENANVLELD